MVEAFNFCELLNIGRYDENCLFLSTLNKMLKGWSYWAVKKGSSVFGG